MEFEVRLEIRNSREIITCLVKRNARSQRPECQSIHGLNETGPVSPDVSRALVSIFREVFGSYDGKVMLLQKRVLVEGEDRIKAGEEADDTKPFIFELLVESRLAEREPHIAEHAPNRGRHILEILLNLRSVILYVLLLQPC